MSVGMPELRTGSLTAGGVALPLTRMEIAGTITGLLHRTKVCQTFVNDHDVPLEAVYMHPLPPKAAVHGFRLVIGDRIVEGRIQERAQARQAYAEAVAQGHRAALMEEERSDIFTTTVGNIAPREQVSVTFELSGPLEFLDSTASLRFPMVVPEVYISGAPIGGGNVGDGTSMDTDSVPDASRITPPRLAPGAPNPVDLRLSFTIDPAGLALEKVDSLCHFAKTRQRHDGCYELSLLPGVERMDRDFVVRLQLKEDTLQTTLIADPETGAFALTVVPPLGPSPHLGPRDLVIVLDRSGSMQGFPMTAARRAATRMVESLTPHDRFGLIAFDNSCELLEPHLLPANARNQQRALEFLSGIDARGGTEARMAIDRALQLLGKESRGDRTVLFITDGDVGNDAELVARASAGVRITTVGIGATSRQGVLERVAKASGGLCTMIADPKTLEVALRDLHLRMGRPQWSGLRLLDAGPCDPAPCYWDVWEGVPTTFFGRAFGLGAEVTVIGERTFGSPLTQRVAVHRRDDLVLHRSWARARLLDLDDQWAIGKVSQNDLVSLSVEAQVLCRFTAFAAIDHSEVVDQRHRLKTVVQPVESTQRAGSIQDQPRSSLLKRGSPQRAGSEGLSRRAAPMLRQTLAGGKPSLGGLSGPPKPSLSIGGPSGPPKPSLSRPAPSPSPACPPPPHSDGPSSPPAYPVRPPSDLFKREQPPTIWETLLKLLEQLPFTPPPSRAALLEKMIQTLGDYCRKLATNSSEANTGKAIMSLLVDLQQVIDEGDDPTRASNILRQELEALNF